MSELDTNNQAHAVEIEALAASWLQRRRYWTWSEDDQRTLDDWLSESLAHGVAYWRLEAGLGHAERFAALKPFSTKPRPPGRRNILPRLLGVAAALGVVAALILNVPWFRNNPLRVYSTTIGGRETLALPDGSNIELNTDTTVRVAVDDQKRILYLDKGEAYFQIQHDIRRPFTVYAGGHRITDLGTKFLIREDGERTEVAVLEGRIKFDAENGSNGPKLLTSGDVIVATAGAVESRKKPLAAISNELGWQHGLLIFDHTRLDHAAAEFNRYNSKKLVIADPQTARLTIDGKFEMNNVELFARVARDVLRLKIATKGEETVIAR